MEEQIRVSNSSVWGSSQYKPDNYQPRKESKRGDVSGRLVAITATGPVYRGNADLAVVPVSVGLAFTQELAARAINPKARVVSSLANRVGEDTAKSAWARTCGFSSSALLGASPRARLMFLNQVLTYVRRQGNVNGIEPILCAAVNAAWPWVDRTALARILTVTSKYLRESKFVASTAIPVVDPNTRTFTLFAPGSLAEIDPNEWLDTIALTEGEFGTPGQADGGFNPNGPGMPGHHGLDFDGLLGQRGGRGGFNPYGPGGLLGSGMPGHHGLDLSGLFGPNGIGARGGNVGGFNPNGPGGLLGPGMPGHHGLDLDGLLGPNGGSPGRFNENGSGGLLGPGMPGHHGLDLSNLGGNGGPYGHGAGLAPGGAADPWDSMKSTGATAKTFGMGVMAVGAGLVGAGLAGGGVGPGGVGILAVGAGFAIFKAGAIIERDAAAGAPPPATGEKPTGGGPLPTVDVHKLPDAKEPKPEEPKHNDLYPDPDGTGGGNPKQLPDFDGSGGGNPATLWDENGGGGNPTTLWDENGGGGNPTTTSEFVTVTALSGRGLLASVVQVGPATFAF